MKMVPNGYFLDSYNTRRRVRSSIEWHIKCLEYYGGFLTAHDHFAVTIRFFSLFCNHSFFPLCCSITFRFSYSLSQVPYLQHRWQINTCFQDRKQYTLQTHRMQLD